VLILPLGRADRDLAEGLCHGIGRSLKRGTALRECALDVERFLDTRRLQYDATALLLALEALYPRTNGVPRPKILGLVAEDLFVPVLTHVFGEAQLGGDFCVVSYHRFQNERYGLPADPSLTGSRLLKESLHELGHTYRLSHCIEPGCVMHSATDVEGIDLQGEAYCGSCSDAIVKVW
jgi:archaemetzincin